MAEWRPYSEAHSIVLAAVWITFAQELTDLPWRKLTAAMRDKAKSLGLTTENPVQNLQVAVNQQGASAVVSQNAAVGFEFVRQESSQVFSEKVQLLRNVVRFETAAYTRWAPFKQRASEFFGVALKTFSENVELERISSEYIDQFHSEFDGSKRPDCSEIVNGSSPMIASKAFHADLPWHSHTGWFDLPDDVSKRLTNVDVTVGDIPKMPFGGSMPVVQIRTHLTDWFNQTDLKALTADVDWSFCDKRLQEQHVGLKAILNGLLSPAAKTLISLS